MTELPRTQSIRCPPQVDLRSFARGEMPPEDVESIGMHVAHCETCSGLLDQFEFEVDTSINDLRSVLTDTTSEFDVLAAEPECDKLRRDVRELSLSEFAPTADLPAVSSHVETSTDTHIGRYFILKELGAGGFATVYLASDPQQERLVAIKVSRPDRVGLKFLELFRQEAQTAAALEHENIVRVLDYGELNDGRCYLVMRYVEGKSLAETIKTEVVDQTRAAKIVAHVARGLHYAHQRGLVHRDIKPANILLDKEGKPLIADFGLAIDEDWKLHPDAFAGTLPFMSPEQIRPAIDIVGMQRHVTSRSDIWSLGVVLYLLLSRKLPFNGKTQEDWQEQILHREPKSLRLLEDSVPLELERIALQCLRKEIPDRPATALDVALAVEACLPPAAPAKTLRSKAALAGLFAGAIVLLLLAIGIRQHFATRPRLIEQAVGVNEPALLLQYKPAAVYFPVGRNPEPIHSAKKQQLTVECGGLGLLELGKTASSDFIFQIDIGKTNWTGDAGLFFGMDTDLLATGVPCKCSAILLRFIDVKDVRIECSSFALQRGPEGVELYGQRTVAQAVARHPGLRGGLLEVEIRGERFHDIRWIGEALPKEFLERVSEQLATTKSLGVVNRNGSTTFRDAKCVLLK